jgi:hypothetical protein
MQPSGGLYQKDFHAWIKGQASLLRQGRLQEIDRVAMKFVVCPSRDGLGDCSADDLTIGRLYEMIAPTIITE